MEAAERRSVAVEVCIDSVASAIAAAEARCERVELCASLVEGGVTPSAGMISVVRDALRARAPTCKLMVLIRPRGADFCYSEHERAVMVDDIQTCKALGVDGVVLGALRPDGTVDVDLVQTLVQAAQPLLVTFHRAIDVARNLLEALDAVIAIPGIQRILSSGGDKTALEGTPGLASMVRAVRARASSMIVVAGGGISERNAARIVAATGVTEIHLSARTSQPSPMLHRANVAMGAAFGPPEYATSVASGAILRSVYTALHDAPAESSPSHD